MLVVKVDLVSFHKLPLHSLALHLLVGSVPAVLLVQAVVDVRVEGS